MCRKISGLMMLAVLVACQENESVTADFTGNETVYALFSGSTYLVSGTVTLQEKMTEAP